MILYDSIFSLGCDCLAQRLITRIAPENGGNSPFAWTQSPNLSVSISHIITPSFQSFIRQDLVPKNGKFSGFIDKRTGLKMNHIWTEEWYGLNDNLYVRKEKEVKDKWSRRWERLLSQLNDPSASPLLLWNGLGPFLSDHLEEWKRLAPNTDIVGRTFDLEEAKYSLEQLRAYFPADIKLLYLSYNPSASTYTCEWMDENLIALSHTVDYPSRIGKEEYWADRFYSAFSPVFSALQQGPTFEERRKTLLNISQFRSHKFSDIGYVVVDTAHMDGHHCKSESPEFLLLSYDPRGEIKIKEIKSGKEKKYEYMGNNTYQLKS